MNKKLKRILIVVGLVVAAVAVGAVIVALMALNQLKEIVTAPPAPMGLDTLPCEPKSQVELGSPYTGGETAEFSTNGSDLYFIARYFHHGGILDLKKYTAGIYVGSLEKNQCGILKKI